MKKLYIIIPVILYVIVLSSFVYSTEYIQCYQESANDSSTTSTNPTLANGNCGLEFTGNYSWFDPSFITNPQNLFDGDWDTFSAFQTADMQHIWINYTKPPVYSFGTRWQIKHFNTSGSTPIVNLTINESCLNESILQLQLSGSALIGGHNLNASCYNGTKWMKMYEFTEASKSGVWYEEAIWWNVSNTTTLNITFVDETTGINILGESFTVHLEKSDFSNTYTGITDNPHTITSLDASLYTKLKVSSDNYQERQYLNVDLSAGTNAIPVNLTVYLINNTDGEEKTFNIVSVDGLAPLQDVKAVFIRTINGSSTIVAEEESDFAGQVVLFLDRNYKYIINFTKAGYEDQTIELEPKNAEYIITMISTIGKYNQSVHEGIRYKFSPSNIVLNNDTKYNFTFTLNSTVWPITNCTMSLLNGSITLNQTSSFTSSSCFLRIEQNTLGMNNITSEVVYEIDSTFNFTVSRQYSVIYTYEGQFSLKNFLDDISDFSMAGFDSFGRMTLAFIVIFVILVLAGREIGFENKIILLFIFWGELVSYPLMNALIIFPYCAYHCDYIFCVLRF